MYFECETRQIRMVSSMQRLYRPQSLGSRLCLQVGCCNRKATFSAHPPGLRLVPAAATLRVERSSAELFSRARTGSRLYQQPRHCFSLLDITFLCADTGDVSRYVRLAQWRSKTVGDPLTASFHFSRVGLMGLMRTWIPSVVGMKLLMRCYTVLRRA